jgi:hypothetical protein
MQPLLVGRRLTADGQLLMEPADGQAVS